MKIALGTVEVNSDERRAIAIHHGMEGLADRETCRQTVLWDGLAFVREDLKALLQVQEGDDR
jgi:hypothetical protein